MSRQSHIVLTEPGRFDTGYGRVVEPGRGEAQVWIRHIGRVRPICFRPSAGMPGIRKQEHTLCL